MNKLLIPSILALVTLSFNLFFQDNQKLTASTVSPGRYQVVDEKGQGLSLTKSTLKLDLNFPGDTDNNVYTQVFDLKWVNGFPGTVTISWKDHYFQAFANIEKDWHFVGFQDIVDDLNEHNMRKRYWIIENTNKGYTMKNKYYGEYLCGGQLQKKTYNAECFWDFKH